MKSANFLPEASKHVQTESQCSVAGRRWNDGLDGLERPGNDVISYGPFKLDNRQKKVYVSANFKYLPPKLFDLLKAFISNPGRVLSQAELAETLWPEDKRADPEDVKQYVHLLRKAIEPDPTKPCWIRNVRGFGYQLVIVK